MADFKKKYDVVVAGAGVSGVAAALAAARMGQSVALLEKQAVTGGLATSGMIIIYLPLCDGMGRQVTFGIAEELMRASLRFSPCRLGKDWGGPGGPDARTRFAAPFSPAGMIVAFEKLLADAGVDLWYDTLVCKTVTSRGAVAAVEVENVSGRGRIEGKRFIDATGDSGVVRRAGGSVTTGHNTNGSTLWFMAGNPDPGRRYPLGANVNIQTIPMYKDVDLDEKYTLSGKGVSEFIRHGHGVVFDHYSQLYAKDPEDRFRYYPLYLPCMPLFRKIAHVNGRAAVNADQFNTRREDSVGLVGDWRAAGKIWETPYGSLLPENLEGILAAGRNICSCGDAWEAFRVIPAAAMTGEVAGTAAALSIAKNCRPSKLSLKQLRSALAAKKFVFHIDDLPPVSAGAASDVFTEE
ncbi:MAG: FAD-dependent oxidoreductase [Lentisphaeria bacterium]|nr:FAD-dependent oxidoreductase [Lentisphaeria bacterium]